MRRPRGSFVKPPNRKERRRLKFGESLPAVAAVSPPMRPNDEDEFERQRQRQIRARPSVRILGADALTEYLYKIVTILGPEYACQSESDFCKGSGCPPEELEKWLKEEWVQHNLNQVESGEEQPGRSPLLLFRQQVGAFYEVRLYSPRTEGVDNTESRIAQVM